MSVGSAQMRESATAIPQVRRRWAPAHYLALLGVLLLVWETWTMISWVASGPTQVTAYRDAGSRTWVAARVYECLSVSLALAMGTSVVRGVIKARRLTLDAKFVICGALAYWTDPFMNFLAPIFSYSSNWTNLNDWTGHVPFWRNPEGGLMGEPVVAIGLFYAFGILLFARVANKAMTWLRRVRPDVSTPQLILFVVGFMFVLDFCLEVPLIALDLQAYPGQPHGFCIPLFGGTRYPLAEGFAFATALGAIAALRFFLDDRGRSIVERGLDHHPGRTRTFISVLALTGAMQGSLVGLNACVAFFGLYASPYPDDFPKHELVDRCGPSTEYGPCPGDDESFRMPIKGQGGVTEIGP